MIQIALSVLIAIGIPALFLLLIYTLDLYASRTFRLVILCFVWGGFGGLALAYLLNTYVAIPLIQALGLSTLFLFVAFAPVIEEIVKSLAIFYIARRPEFTYFVDGAIYGFAAGIGFSVIENFLYLSGNPGAPIPLALTRAFSTCLMHGTATGLVGAAVGRFRFQHGPRRGLLMATGWVAAILLHALFNAAAHAVTTTLGTILAMAIGLAGVGLIALFITMGLREERQWLAETLDRQVGVTAAERRAAQAYSDMDEILKPITQHFPRKAELVQAMLLLQAQMGIKRKVQQKITDPHLKQQLEQEVDQMQAEMEKIRRQVGLCVMTYVRSVFPEGARNLWGNLELLAACSDTPDLQRWARMLTTEEIGLPPGEGPRRDIFAQLRERQGPVEDPRA